MRDVADIRREIWENREKALVRAKRAVERAQGLYSCTFYWHALEQLHLAGLEMKAIQDRQKEVENGQG